MIVPEHISVTGEPLKSLGFENQDVPQKERLMQMMNVPDRIVLKGGDSYEGFDAQPSELMDDHINHISKDQLQDLPHTITLAESPYLDRGGTTDEPVRSENSIAVEENPLQELKLMRRQIVPEGDQSNLGRISSRLFQLEYELEQRRFRDKSIIILGTIFVIMSVPDIELEDFNETFDNWLLDTDDGAAVGLDGDDMALAVVPDLKITDDD
ncbi:unnamed protein product [Haemonchus placei]|uniref:Mitochondrial fission factor n=1 Tax=Haemonchus placei TaxID=6290 RepID=A0A158QNH0_HAEPC|nr:unnamed protein product [Haemonchus placei]